MAPDCGHTPTLRLLSRHFEISGWLKNLNFIMSPYVLNTIGYQKVLGATSCSCIICKSARGLPSCKVQVLLNLIICQDILTRVRADFFEVVSCRVGRRTDHVHTITIPPLQVRCGKRPYIPGVSWPHDSYQFVDSYSLSSCTRLRRFGNRRLHKKPRDHSRGL